MASPLVNAVGFMKSFGIFDVVLPFLLVFTVIFGVLEKTKIFGEENGKTRKNINSMVAFSVAFFVIAATQVVNVMQAALPMIMLLLVLVIAFMIVYGSTLSEGQMNLWDNMDKAKKAFAFGLFIAIIAIVLGAMNMLEGIINWIFSSISGPAASTVILLLVIGIFMWIVIGKDSSTE
ncbi:hypothetical protein HN992_03760 [Candidatus Woesearchaeota archaeon]|jgi:hypothetical protein|nr:hypothetical protein [Candidatus Woesearchaeota archaeon]MBT3438429.1 hypothetical protein [Candidatus Woesearchaeota archaeon]MBT4058105.1 hypothetical protein [Candidatus Woesearchaeota archaeon]MBT4208999.1 hypothetical protein [Candidatus Woesearchaeota archaeon]MBT4731708.1 hypothetical protein [Candidatus Woesearchaeota archaeon]